MSTATSSRPGFFRRLWRAFVALVKIVFVLAILIGLVAAGWFGYQELDRSFNSLAERYDINARRIAELNDDVEALATERNAQGAQLDDLAEDVATLETEVTTMTEQLTADLARHQDVLSDLEEHVTTLVASTGAITENVDTLSAGVIALQGDVNENIAAVDELGGNVDELGADVTELGQAFGTLETEVMSASGEASEAVMQMGQALTLFRAWEMIYRARLRLLEQNAGLATDDVAMARTMVSLVVENSEGDSREALAALQQRLELAAANLPGDPDTAVRDLESAWEMLDTILADLLGVPEIGVLETAVITPTTTLTPTTNITATQPITATP